MTQETTPSPALRRSSSKLGRAALVLALVAAGAAFLAGLVTGIVGVVGAPPGRDNAVYEGIFGGVIIFLGAVALLSPLSFLAAALGVISLWRPGRKAAGIVALVVGLIGSLGLVGFPFVLGQLVPAL